MEVVIEVGGFQPVVVVEVGVVTALAIALAVVFIIRPNEAAMVLATDVGTVDDLVAVNGASRKRATSLGAVPKMAPAFLIECCLILSKRFSFFIQISEILSLFFFLFWRNDYRDIYRAIDLPRMPASNWPIFW